MYTQTLKGIIPSPILKASLDAMGIHKQQHQEDEINQYDDDVGHDEDNVKDEQHTKKKQKMSKEYKENVEANGQIDKARTQGISKLKLNKKHGNKNSDATMYRNSLVFKEGRNVNTSIYYFNQFKQVGTNEDGLNSTAGTGHQDSVRNMKHATDEKARIDSTLTSLLMETERLKAQPTNIELNDILMNIKSNMIKLGEEIGVAETYICNKRKVVSLKRGIDQLSKIWKIRKQMCLEFLNTMEELSEGSINVKNCFNHSGPICLESDPH
jgi:hypothetical protein